MPTEPTWDDLIPLYTSALKSGTLSPRTVQLRLYHLQRIRRAVGVEPGDVTLQMLTDYFDPDWAANTKGVVQSAMKKFFGWAVDYEYLTKNPARRLPSIRTPHGVPKPATRQAVDEARTKSSPRVAMMVDLGADLGLRCMEIAAVHPRDVEGDPGLYNLRILGKGSKTRLIPISDEMAERIYSAGNEYVFPGRDHGHVSPAYVSRLISKSLPPGVTAHKLRHKFGTDSLRRGKNLRVTQELMGHASVATTQGYTAVDAEELRQAALPAR